MENNGSMFDGQRKTASGGAKPGEARAGRPRDIGRRRFVVAGLTVGPILSTLGTTSSETFAKGSKGSKFPKGTACHSNSLSKLASFHPGTKKCPTSKHHK